MFKTVPEKGSLAVIRIRNGVLEVWSGKYICNEHDDLFLIEECIIMGNEILIKARNVAYLKINRKITESEGYETFRGQDIDFWKIINMAYDGVNIILKHRKKASWLDKFRGKKDVNFNYITLKDNNVWNECGRKIKLKTDYWRYEEFQSNVYILNHLG